MSPVAGLRGNNSRDFLLLGCNVDDTSCSGTAARRRLCWNPLGEPALRTGPTGIVPVTRRMTNNELCVSPDATVSCTPGRTVDLPS